MKANLNAKSKQPSKVTVNKAGTKPVTSTGGAVTKINNAHPVGRKGDTKAPQVTTSSTKQPVKVTNAAKLFNRVKNVKLFKD